VYMYHRTLRLSAAHVRCLGIVVNIGLTRRAYPPRRRWFSTHFLQSSAHPKQSDAIVPIPLSLWHEVDDTFEHTDQTIIDDLCRWTGMGCQEFSTALKRRIDCLEELSQGGGVALEEMHNAIVDLRKQEQTK